MFCSFPSVPLRCIFPFLSTLSWAPEWALRSPSGTGQEVGFIGAQLSLGNHRNVWGSLGARNSQAASLLEEREDKSSGLAGRWIFLQPGKTMVRWWRCGGKARVAGRQARGGLQRGQAASPDAAALTLTHAQTHHRPEPAPPGGQRNREGALDASHLSSSALRGNWLEM